MLTSALSRTAIITVTTPARASVKNQEFRTALRSSLEQRVRCAEIRCETRRGHAAGIETANQRLAMPRSISASSTIADRASYLVRQDDRGAQRAASVAKLRQLDPRSGGLDAQGADAVES
jgi:hypothetical protein